MRHATGVRLRSKGEKEEEETQLSRSRPLSARACCGVVRWYGGTLECVWRARARARVATTTRGIFLRT